MDLLYIVGSLVVFLGYLFVFAVFLGVGYATIKQIIEDIRRPW